MINDKLTKELQEQITENKTKIEYIEDGLIYSTNEVKTDNKWIDGKPIYRKVINFGALPNNTSKSVNHNIQNIKRIINMYGYSMRPDTSNTFICPNNPTYNSLTSGMYANETAVTVNTYSDRSSFSETYIILEYTKTTD